MSHTRQTYENPATAELRMRQAAEIEKTLAAGQNQAIGLAELMRIPAFRKVVSHWMEECGLDASINHKNSNDREQALGKREIGLFIKKELVSVSPDLYDLMVKEAREAKDYSRRQDNG